MTSWSWTSASWLDSMPSNYDSYASAYARSADAAWAADASHISPMIGSQVTTKIPPSYDGRRLWFTYEEEIDDWCDITELDADKRGPALRNRLDGEAAVYKSLLDRDALRDPNTGVEYFKRTMRPHFVKGASSVFLWRFMQVTRFHRGTSDMLRWLGRVSVMRKRLQDAWMDLFEPWTMNTPEFLQEMQQAVLRGGNVDPVAALEAANANRVAAHVARFPFGQGMFSLMTIVLADLTEQQRERFMSVLMLRGIQIHSLNFELVRSIFVDLFLCTDIITGESNVSRSEESKPLILCVGPG